MRGEKLSTKGDTSFTVLPLLDSLSLEVFKKRVNVALWDMI